MIRRREVLKLALGCPAAGLGSILPACPAAAEANPAGFGLADPVPFDPAMVAETARALAKQPYKAVPSDTPDIFRNLGYDQYVGIRHRTGTAIWASDTIGFALEPLHRGFIFSTPMQINLVTRGQARRVLYDPGLFDFGPLAVPQTIGDIGFSGFRVLVAQPDKDAFSEIATFQGASFFRAVARGQNPGPMARAMSIKTADPRGEEFPAIRSVWIERPTLAENRLVIHALIDSASLTGAYRFTLRPGEATLIDTECTLFARTTVDNFGLATMSATVVSGSLGLRRCADLRPIVAETGGMQMLTGKGEWLWRPVANRDTLQVSTFVDEKPRGFGFLQRDRAFDHYQDDTQHWEMRPSLWIEPIGEWAAGGVQLVEIPSESEVNDNIIAFWKPREPLAANSETNLAYRQFWCWSPPERPDLAVTALSREGRGTTAKRRRFLVEFAGDVFGGLAKAEDVTPELTATPGSIPSLRTFLSAKSKTCRVLFELDPEGEAYSELRLVLEVAGHPISETWLYRWTP
jgi:glucans biosynthesis protein